MLVGRLARFPFGCNPAPTCIHHGRVEVAGHQMWLDVSSVVRFYWTWFTMAFFHPLGLAALVLWVLGAIGYVAKRWFLVPEEVLADIAWQLSLGLVAVLSVARLVAVPYWIVRGERAARSAVEEERDSLLRRMDQREERQAVLDRLGALFGQADILIRPRTSRTLEQSSEVEG